MITPAPTRHTVREQIMQNLQAIFEAAPSDPDDISWGVVTRKVLNKTILGTNPYAIGLYDTSEKIQEGVGWEMRTFNVVLEFHVALMENDEPSTFLNHCLGQVETRIGQDISLGGLASNCQTRGSELDIDGAFDKYVSGILIVAVSYRCSANNPYNRV